MEDPVWLGIMSLLAQVLQRCPQRGAGYLDQTVKRSVQLEDEEDGG